VDSSIASSSREGSTAEVSSSGSSLFTGSSASDNSSDSEDYEGSSSSSEDHPEDEVKLHGGSEGAEGSSSSPGGYALTLEGLKLDNIGVLEVVQAQLQLLCSRCDSRFAVVLMAEGGHRAAATAAAGSSAAAAAGSPSTQPRGAAAAAAINATHSSSSSRSFEWCGSCAVCSQGLNVLLRPRFVHEGSNILAGLKLQGCRPLDLLPSVYGATCADCDAVGALRALQVGWICGLLVMAPVLLACARCKTGTPCHTTSRHTEAGPNLAALS
jgi:hypothetical protein